jgi:cytochrome b561
MSSIGSVRDTAPSAEPADRRYALTEYRMPAKVFHWLTVGLLFFMVASGVMAKQIWEGDFAETLFIVHKLTGLATLAVVLLRLGYRLLGTARRSKQQPRTRPILHWTLYALVILVPLLAWAALSDFGHLEFIPGFKLPAIWPQGLGYDEVLLRLHAYFAFGLLALIALHIGVAMQDYMNNQHGEARRDDA